MNSVTNLRTMIDRERHWHMDVVPGYEAQNHPFAESCAMQRNGKQRKVIGGTQEYECQRYFELEMAFIAIAEVLRKS